MPDKKNLPATTNSSQRNALQNTGTSAQNLIDQAFSNLSHDEIGELRREVTRRAVEMELNERERQLQFQGAKQSVELHIETVKAMENGSKLSGHKIASEPIKNMRIESKTGATCFVATAAYGDPEHADVAFLRQYRNKTLRKSALGRAFIATYWRVGPALAKPVKASPRLQRITRSAIGFLVAWLRTRETPV